jgi:hypothetical protein
MRINWIEIILDLLKNNWLLQKDGVTDNTSEKKLRTDTKISYDELITLVI